MAQDNQEFIKVNRILGKQTSIGPIPSEQLVPWIAIIIVCYVATNGFLSLGMGWFFATSFWLIVSWWILTGNQPHEFLDRWRNPPGTEWCNGNSIYISPIPQYRPPWMRRRYEDSQVRIRLKPLIVPKQYGGNSKFMPFQNEVNICCIAEIKKDEREVAALLLDKGKSQYQLVFGFRIAGLHDLLNENEVSEFAHSIEEGLKELPIGEKITFCTGCYSDDPESPILGTNSAPGIPRQTQLTSLADNCQIKAVSVLFRNEQLRVEQLQSAGSRQIWSQIAFCTWTSEADSSHQQKDFVGGLIAKFSQFGTWTVEKITGNKRLYQEIFFKKLLLQGFQQGFIQWELLLNTKIGLEVTPCNATDLWQVCWNRFNQGTAPPIPQVITLKETETGLELTETVTTDKHICTLLIEGQQGRSACPEHRGDHDRVYLTGKDKVCGVMVVTDPPVGWSNTQDQLKWIWKILASSYVHDTEAWIEISRSNDFFIQDNLARQAKQSKTARTLAITKGQGRDIGAELKQEESFEAQRRLYQGTKALHCAPIFLVYRHSTQELTHACNLLANSFETAKVIRERNIAWEIWLQTLPITCKWLLHGGNLSERRMTLDTHTVAGIMPLTVPKDIDQQGVEFLTGRGGKPIYVDLFHQQIGRALITGTSGSGKSVLGWRFALEALANNIPVVGMDISAGGHSTFKTAIELLGEQGAYYDISSGSSNLMEPPDLRRFDKLERERRMESWKDFIRKALTAIAMGKVQNPHLAQRVDALLVKALDIFIRDSDIVARYNQAFEKGWLSPQWQQIPTLPDFVKFCTRERLNLRSFEDIDRQALNQIHSQVSALLASRLGKAIARPSTFSPAPTIKFFALSGLSNEQDAYLMAINAHTACIRNALSHPKSLFIGDELSVLLRKEGFAQVIGETCATGRKEGIAVILLSQDPDTICECATGAQIMQNMTYRITGRITSSGVASFQRYLGYPVNMITHNATDAFLPRTSDLYSCWLVETGGRFWRTRFYPGELMLATVANNQDEREARERVMAQYPDTPKGKLLGLRTFTDAYIPALKENKGFHHIGQERHQATQQGDLPPTTEGDHDWQSRNEGDSAERCAGGNRLTPALSAKHTFRYSPKN
ncbi:hypothetical protein [Nodularia sp. LEGE 04288]|uniref:hypothetical protein n=1 Tax=Nodularia sp. LEGE 04288 TaxID=1828639 RepID=UPI001D1124D9|nr:hypothetical protein [Nodularia sp. LEGE 04288]